MSAGNIDFISSLWAASLAHHNDVPLFKNTKAMYNTIDSTPLGDVPWQSFTLNYNGNLPDGKVPPSWMEVNYGVWYRDLTPWFITSYPIPTSRMNSTTLHFMNIARMANTAIKIWCQVTGLGNKLWGTCLIYWIHWHYWPGCDHAWITNEQGVNVGTCHIRERQDNCLCCYWPKWILAGLYVDWEHLK